MRRALVPLALVLAGCNATMPTGQEAMTENEALAITETARFAQLVGVRVGAEIVDRDPWAGLGTQAWARYNAGTVYWIRPWVNRLGQWNEMSGTFNESVTNVACHEVCHAKTGQAHDVRHWRCMNEHATPTYPEPKAGTVAASEVF